MLMEMNYILLLFFADCHLVGVIWTGRWEGERNDRITEVTS